MQLCPLNMGSPYSHNNLTVPILYTQAQQPYGCMPLTMILQLTNHWSSCRKKGMHRSFWMTKTSQSSLPRPSTASGRCQCTHPSSRSALSAVWTSTCAPVRKRRGSVWIPRAWSPSCPSPRTCSPSPLHCCCATLAIQQGWVHYRLHRSVSAMCS